MRLDKKTALVTGGSSGIGKAVAQRFIREGANVIVFDIKRPDYAVEFYQVDVTKEDQIQKAFSGIRQLDVLVNNAGIYFQASVEKTTKEELDQMTDINWKGVYLMSKHALPLLKRSRGNIINISSGLGLVPEPQSSLYCSTKAAVIMLTKCMALENASIGVRVNAILPGPIDTPLLRNTHTQKEMEEIAAGNPMRRIGKPEEVAAVASFLASDEAGYVTGGLYSVDGGETAL
ncbi:MAG: SDR family oxidoreductase [Candidatus Aenigmarchaeota archaeon]|nr:SDR family oxidoreductase [Candidatus Aenigmarchaeota archaeon]